MKNLLLVLAVAALATVAQATSYTTSLSDNFSNGYTAGDDLNVNLAGRQSGTHSTSAWKNMGGDWACTFYDTLCLYSLYDTPAMVVQDDLVQASSYRVSWDQQAAEFPGYGNPGNYNFVQLNCLGTSMLNTGFSVNNDNGVVAFWVDGNPIYVETYAPTGPANPSPPDRVNYQGNMHHFDVTVVNGFMTALVDGHEWDYDFNNSTNPNNTKGAGIGVFAFGIPVESVGFIDNFEYQVQVPEPATMALLGFGGLLLGRKK